MRERHDQASRDLNRISQRKRWAAHRQRVADGTAIPCVPLTPSMRGIELVLIGLAQAHNPLPNNARLAEMAGCRRNTILRALIRLEALGRIEMDYSGRRRACTVAENRQSTAWGIVRAGHKPFCSQPRPAREVPSRPPSTCKGYGHAPRPVQDVQDVPSRPPSTSKRYFHAPRMLTVADLRTPKQPGRRRTWSLQARQEAGERCSARWAALSPEQQAERLARLAAGKNVGGASRKSDAKLDGARMAARRRRAALRDAN